MGAAAGSPCGDGRVRCTNGSGTQSDAEVWLGLGTATLSERLSRR